MHEGFVRIRPMASSDRAAFLQAVERSASLHHPWVCPPVTEEGFQGLLERSLKENQRTFVVENNVGALVGIFNLSEIVRGCFQSAYLGYYAFAPHQGQGYMSQGLALVLREAFTTVGLHRVEANVQPLNQSSIALLLRHRFTREGFSKRYLQVQGEWKDHERFAITVEDWEGGDRDWTKA